MGSRMISRALVLALLWCARARGGALSAAGDDNDCALYLSGPGRTSAYDYSLNLLKGNFGYEGQHTCITYDAVNRAYFEARNRILVSQPKGDWKPEDFASVGELILDISINLARTYGLTYEEIEKGLPLIDTSRTLIREVCPPVFSHVECRAGKYRRLDGLCNNLQHPTWGATNAPFQRLIGPLFSDGINAPRISHTGRDLPLSRVVSRTMHPDDGFHDHAGTVMVIAWGQFMDHDYTLTGTPLDPINRNDPEECCKRPLHLKHPYCNEIRIPDDDYFYRLFGVKCIDFVRGFPSPRPGCRLGSRVPFNTLTGAIDGNTVYGVTDKFARKLRTGYGGLLRMNPVFKEYGLKDLLPLKLDIPDEGCTRPNKHMYCFEAGEIRVNEQLVLTVMHTLMAREHNRVAHALAAVNPHWDDETLYQEARRINIAEIQHITYNEFLPILLGKDVMEKFGLVLEKQGYWEGYDPHVNPDVLASFAAAAYRFGHSLLPTAVERWSKAHKFIASKRLSDLIRRPYDLYRAGVLDEYVMGLMNQVAQAMDDSITQEVTNHLFKKVGARFGMDLVSFNMQRGREFGLPGYMEFRKFCGLSGADSFQDLFGAMSNDTVRKYETIFEHPIDVDLWSGGVSERPLPGSMLGPTFACVIATQFSYSRRGDRFWFELPHQPSSFTPEQLAEIRKSRLSRVICDNTDIIDTVQLYPMVLPDHELNPRVPCRSGIIPSMDFTKWAEPAPFHSAKEFMTDAYIPPKNETNGDKHSVDGNGIVNGTANNCKDPTVKKEQNGGCNNTVDINAHKSPEVKVQLTENNTSSSNNAHPAVSTHDCAEKANDTSNCVETQIKSNEIRDSDTVMKYVYKKDEKVDVPDKSKGHPKNSVKRRKRALYNSNEDVRYAESVPLIVNYKTSHPPQGEKPFERIRDVIKNSDLADFNIETLHENIQPDKNSEDIKDKSKKVYFDPKPLQRPQAESVEIFDRDEYRDHTKNSKPYKEIDESDERSGHSTRERGPQRESNSKPYEESDESVESGNKNDHRENNREPSHNRKGKPHRHNEDSGERSDYRENKREPSHDRNDKLYRHNEDSGERSDYRENKREPHDHNGKPYINNEDSGERSNYSDNKRQPYNDRQAKAYRDGEDSGEKGDYRENEKRTQHDRNSKVYRDSNESGEKNDYRESNEEPPRNRVKKPYTESEESGERSDYRESKKEPLRDRDSSASDENSRHKASYSTPRTDSSESREGEQSDESSYLQQNKKQSYASPPRDSSESRENKQNEQSSYAKHVSSKESHEKDGYYKNQDKSAYKKPRGHITESKENYRDGEKPLYRREPSANTDSAENRYNKNNDNPSVRQPDNIDESEEEEEEIIAIMKKKNRKATDKPREDYKSGIKGLSDKSSPIKIKDVDLDDFSYERINVNDKGLVEPAKDTHENYETDSQVEIAPTATQIPQVESIVNGNQYSRSIESIDSPSGASIQFNNDEIGEDNKGPIINKVNNGEVRPVVEINSDSGELNDDNSKEALKSSSGNEDTSLETLLGVKLPDGSDQIDKTDLQQNTQQKGDVKQQFERIPLNYKHDKNEQKPNHDNLNSKPVETSNVDIDDVTPNQEGTLDELTPNDHTFDENLNIKFDDLTIKLPEIKLPKDILAYTYEEPTYEKQTDTDKVKPNFYRYSDEYNSEEKPRKEKIKDDYNDYDDDHHGYRDYYGKNKKKDSYKKKQEEEDGEDEDVDLYEKFVRERFGKRGSFEKRSEKLQDSRPVQTNPQLYNTLRQVLKKTEDIDKQAKKSGDPNAGYMWTLEYGQPL